MLTARTIDPLAIVLFTLLSVGIAAPQDDAERQTLIIQRDNEKQQLTFHESMLATPSFAARSDLFCKNVADASLANGSPSFAGSDPSIPFNLHWELERLKAQIQHHQNGLSLVNSIEHGPDGLTLADLKNAYTRLMREHPSTREDELERQEKLSAVGEGVADYEKEFAACRVAVLYGKPSRGIGDTDTPPFPLPTDDELREQIRQHRERIAQIEHELASGMQAEKMINTSRSYRQPICWHR
jgi:hypothetical protein